MLFLTLGAVSYLRSQYGPGAGPVFLDDIDCTGAESNVTDCGRRDFSDVSSNCLTHSEDAAVECPTGNYEP